MRWIVVALILVMGLSAASAGQVTWKATAFEKGCVEQESGADEGQDYLFKRCQGIGTASLWVLYNEGVRMSVGFGRTPHVAVQYLETARDDKLPIEWGGEMRGGKFLPQVAIARFKALEQTKSTLYVFRLLPQGASCIVGQVEAGSEQNKKAKAIATDAIKAWTCLSEPIPVTS